VELEKEYLVKVNGIGDGYAENIISVYDSYHELTRDHLEDIKSKTGLPSNVVENLVNHMCYWAIEKLKKNENFENELEPDFDFGFINARAFSVVIGHLINNSLKYADEVKIYEEDGDICIEDDGIGVTEEEKYKIFYEFYKSPRAKELDSMGYGLGLHIAKTIVDSGDRELVVESDGEDKGSVFKIVMEAG